MNEIRLIQQGKLFSSPYCGNIFDSMTKFPQVHEIDREKRKKEQHLEREQKKSLLQQGYIHPAVAPMAHVAHVPPPVPLIPPTGPFAGHSGMQRGRAFETGTTGNHHIVNNHSYKHNSGGNGRGGGVSMNTMSNGGGGGGGGGGRMNYD